MKGVELDVAGLLGGSSVVPHHHLELNERDGPVCWLRMRTGAAEGLQRSQIIQASSHTGQSPSQEKMDVALVENGGAHLCEKRLRRDANRCKLKKGKITSRVMRFYTTKSTDSQQKRLGRSQKTK